MHGGRHPPNVISRLEVLSLRGARRSFSDGGQRSNLAPALMPEVQDIDFLHYLEWNRKS